MVLIQGSDFALRISKKMRQSQIVKALSEDPFLKDEELAKRYRVSIQTIRLDRMELGIPELRERIKLMAEENFDQVRSISPDDVIGEVIELQFNQSGISILDIKEEHVFVRNPIARGHSLFAQANSLAVAIIDGKVVLTQSAHIRFIRPVEIGERCVAHAKVIEKDQHRFQVHVETRVNQEAVFQGTFHVYRLEDGVQS